MIQKSTKPLAKTVTGTKYFLLSVAVNLWQQLRCFLPKSLWRRKGPSKSINRAAKSVKLLPFGQSALLKKTKAFKRKICISHFALIQMQMQVKKVIYDAFYFTSAMWMPLPLSVGKNGHGRKYF